MNNNIKLRGAKEAHVKIIPLGGLREVGKNITVLEFEDEIIIIDCGMTFPDSDRIFGVDIVYPDLTYLIENKNKIKGLLVTHAHEDHIGAIPYLLQRVNVPIFATEFTNRVITNKLKEHKLDKAASLTNIVPGRGVKLGSFHAEFIHVNHSIPGAVAIAINTPVGCIMHTGDFKIDTTPVGEDSVIDLQRFAEYGIEGVKLMLCDSTNAEREGMTVSESTVRKSIFDIFRAHQDKRITVSTFASNVHRLQTIIDASIENGRKIAVTGRSMINMSDVAGETGHLQIPEAFKIPISDVSKYKNEEVTILTTGSQGEAMAALSRMSAGEHKDVKLDKHDLVILSSHTIPGNEGPVNTVLNRLIELGVTLITDMDYKIHASGHAYAGELRLMHRLVQPEFFVPAHGEYKHMVAHKQLAIDMGMHKSDIIIARNGSVLYLYEDGIEQKGNVKASELMLDKGGLMQELHPGIIKERKYMAADGALFLTIKTCLSCDGEDTHTVERLSIASKGFTSHIDMELVIGKIEDLINRDIASVKLNPKKISEHKKKITASIQKYIYNKLKKHPLIVIDLEEIE